METAIRSELDWLPATLLNLDSLVIGGCAQPSDLVVMVKESEDNLDVLVYLTTVDGFKPMPGAFFALFTNEYFTDILEQFKRINDQPIPITNYHYNN